MGEATILMESALRSYVPDWLIECHREETEAPVRPRLVGMRCGVLLADIAGFTALAEALARRGDQGAEELTRHLNHYFGRMIEIVASYGGDVTKFAGDAMLAVWPEDSVASAARCALVLQGELDDCEMEPGLRLSMRIGIGAGLLNAAVLGGVGGRWETVLTGGALEGAARAEGRCRAGAVVLAPEAWRLLQQDFDGSPLDDGHVHLLSARRAADPTPREPAGEVAEVVLRSYIPRSVLHRLEAGQEAWLAELRRVSVLFVHLEGLTEDSPLERAQETLRSLQEILFRLGGTLNKVASDSKGSSLLAAMGLPPQSQEDDAARAVQAAMEIKELLTGTPFGIGVTTGRAFCGTVGNARRREYTLIGDVVNLSARLMQAGRQDVLCDEATRALAADRIEFEPLEPLKVKGRSGRVPVFRPRRRARAKARRSPVPMVGRQRERAEVDRAFAELHEGRAGVLLIEGEPGIGKSRLVEEVLEQAAERGLPCLVAEAEAVERSTPWYAWRPVFREVFGFDRLPEDREERRRHVLRRLEALPDLVELAPLLNAVLPLDLPDNERTEHLQGQVRFDNTEMLLREVLLRLRQADGRRADARLVVAVEDGHWLDSASWALVEGLGREAEQVLVVLSTRPLEAPVPPEYDRLLRRPVTTRLSLESLSREEALELVRRRLGVQDLPEEVATFIGERAEGNPFFSEETAWSLRDTGVIEVEGGRCRLAEGADLREIDFPQTLEGVTTSRIDRLEPTRQMILKVASVLGRSFRLKELEHVYPVEADRPALPEHLDALASLDLTPLEVPVPRSHVFKHSITRDVVYNMMLFSQRRQLHRAAAAWYEREFADELPDYYPLLAHHWSKAEEPSRAVEYLEKAAEQALSRGANREAQRFFSDCLDLAPDAPVPRRARWEHGLGEAWFGMGDTPRARRHLRQAADLMGVEMPPTMARMALGLLGEIGRQAWFRTPFVRLPERPASDERMAPARLYNTAALAAYLGADILATVYKNVRALNLAEQAGRESAEAAVSRSTLSVLLGQTPLRFASHSYADRALATAERAGNPRALCRVRWVVALQRMVYRDWSSAFELFEASLAWSRRMADWENLCYAADIYGYGRYYHGDLDQALELYEECTRVGVRSENRQHEEWGHAGAVGVLLARGRYAEAEPRLERALALFEGGTHDPTEEFRTWVNLARLRLHNGVRSGAMDALDMAEVVRRKHLATPSDYHTMDGYSGVVATWAALARTAGSEKERRRCAARARQGLKHQRAYTDVFPWGRPRLLLSEGLVQDLEGAAPRALSCWRRCAEEAERRHMRWEGGLAHAWMARYEPGAGHLEAARRLLEEVGAVGDFDGG